MNLQWHALSLSLERLLPLIVLLPALGFLFNALGGRRRSRPIVHLVGVGTVACSFHFSVLAFVKLAALAPEARSAVWHGWEWFVVRLAPPLGSADDVRIPIDLDVRVRQRLGPVELVGDVGALAAILAIQGVSQGASEGGGRFELGLRGALLGRVPLGVFSPYLGVEAAFVPKPYEIALHRQGTIGSTPAVWLGAALGLSMRVD